MYSNFYNKYQLARNLSWDIILKYNISSLPVEVLTLCDNMGIKVYSYQKASTLIDRLGLAEDIKDNDGLSLIYNGKYIIFYDNSIEPFARRRFTVCHELGHILLGHVEEISPRYRSTQWNRNAEEPNEDEAAANIFASRLLAPACVLNELDISTVEDLTNLTGLSDIAASIRLNRLQKLEKRNNFYLSSKEKAVYRQFEKFINNYPK